MNTNEQAIWDYLIQRIPNPFGVAGLMGNLYAESGFNPQNLQNSYNTKLGMSDAEYTQYTDLGSYKNFAGDGAGYGLAQWTYHSRKAGLLKTAQDMGRSVGDLDAQLQWLWDELNQYSAVLRVLQSAASVREASDKVMISYEKPANQSEAARLKREQYGIRFYEEHAGDAPASPPEKKEAQMGYDRQRVIDIALAEEGYLEKATNAQLDSKTANAGSNNYTKYARDMDAIPGFYNGKKQGVAWCDIFVDWCFVQAYGIDAGRGLLCQPLKSSGAGCKYSRNYFKAKGRLFSSPEPGDQIFFYPKDGIGGSAIAHTGLVYKVDSSTVYTVEGNTSSASGVVANGGCVRKKSYKLSYNRIAGYGRPAYESEGTVVPGVNQPEPDEPEQPLTGKVVCVTGKSVNIRTGNGTEFDIAGVLKQGVLAQWIATADNGWHAILYKKKVLWISGRYTEVRDDAATE